MNADQQAPAVLLEMQFQEFLREFRAKHGLTQQMPADALEISRNTLKAWEPDRRGQDKTGDAAPAWRSERQLGLSTACRFRPAPLAPAATGRSPTTTGIPSGRSLTRLKNVLLFIINTPISEMQMFAATSDSRIQ